MTANFTYTNALLHNLKTASLHNPMAYFFFYKNSDITECNSSSSGIILTPAHLASL